MCQPTEIILFLFQLSEISWDEYHVVMYIQDDFVANLVIDSFGNTFPQLD